MIEDKEKAYPNFLQGLLLTICLMIILLSSWLVGFYPLRLQIHLPEFYIPLVTLIASVFCIPIVYYALKKSKINLLKDLYFPNLKFLTIILLLAISIKILSQPIISPVRFFHSFSNGQFESLFFKSIRFDLAFSIRIFHTIILGPVIEEVFFRRILLNQFLKRYKAIFALFLSAILFTIYHCDPNIIWFLFFYGLIYGYIFYKTYSLIACILFHSSTNLLAYITQAGSMPINDNTLGRLFFLFSGSIICIYVFEKYTAWFQNRELFKDEKNNFGA